MGRLKYMSDIEFALLTIQQELAFVERYVSSGWSLVPDSISELKDGASRLQAIIKVAEVERLPTWETDSQVRPEWLQPKTITIEDEQEQTKTRPA